MEANILSVSPLLEQMELQKKVARFVFLLSKKKH